MLSRKIISVCLAIADIYNTRIAGIAPAILFLHEYIIIMINTQRCVKNKEEYYMIDYESAWKHLKTFVSDGEFHSRPYKGDGFRAVLLKMEELEEALKTDEPKDSTTLPDIRIGEFIFERSKLPKFTAEDFEVAKAAFEASDRVYRIAHEFESQMIETSNAAAREVDTWVLDIFKTLYGCKSVDDVYLKMTHQQYFKEFKRVIERVNERLEYIDNSQAKCEYNGDTITYYPLHGYRLSVPKEPIKPSEELYQNLKSLWEEIYNEN